LGQRLGILVALWPLGRMPLTWSKLPEPVARNGSWRLTPNPLVKPGLTGYLRNQRDETHVMVTLAKGKTHGAPSCAPPEV
jgi:hypothetical protein